MNGMNFLFIEHSCFRYIFLSKLLNFRYILMKVSEQSLAVLLLWKILQNGEISLSDTAKTVWESDSVLMTHKLDIFRTRFNKIKFEEEK